MSLELRQLRHVLAVASHGSFARAALALRLSQPALSRSVQGVEAMLGAALFYRQSSGTAPTDAGRLFIERARQVVQLAESLDRQALAERVFQYGEVAAGGGPYPSRTILPRAMARFIEASPRVTARLLVRDWDDLLRSLQRQEIDFFVAETSTLEKDPQLALVPMAEHPLFFVARDGHPLKGRRDVVAAEALAYPLVSLSRLPPRILESMRAVQRGALERGIMPCAFPAAECNDQGAMVEIVRGSNAIMAATLPGVARELERGELVVIGSEPWMRLRYGIVRLKGRPTSVEAEMLIGFVLEAERENAIDEERLIARWVAPVRPARRKRPR